MKNQIENKGEIVIYKAEDGQTAIDVRLQDETVWLMQDEMAKLFKLERTVITKHINNIFKTGELDERSNVQKMHMLEQCVVAVFAPGELVTKEMQKKGRNSYLSQ